MLKCKPKPGDILHCVDEKNRINYNGIYVVCKVEHNVYFNTLWVYMNVLDETQSLDMALKLSAQEKQHDLDVSMEYTENNFNIIESDKPNQGWIGVDLDGCLAHYDKWISSDYIGEPVQLMVDRVKLWVDQGITVKIFTARASFPNQTSIIHKWLNKNGLPTLEVTNIKDLHMIELWDDRCIRVEKNTGMVIKR